MCKASSCFFSVLDFLETFFVMNCKIKIRVLVLTWNLLVKKTKSCFGLGLWSTLDAPKHDMCLYCQRQITCLRRLATRI